MYMSRKFEKIILDYVILPRQRTVLYEDIGFIMPRLYDIETIKFAKDGNLPFRMRKDELVFVVYSHNLNILSVVTTFELQNYIAELNRLASIEDSQLEKT